MRTRAGQTGSGPIVWLTPLRVVLVGAVIVMLLLFLPIRTLGPGDDEQQSCGNALSLDLGPWQGYPSENYLEKASRVCGGERVDRIAWAVLVESTTVLAAVAVSALVARSRRRATADGAGS